MNKEILIGGIMQKNYKEFTVGELLELGFKVELSTHILNEDEAKKSVNLFEGTKRSTHELTNETKVVKAWKEKFHVNLFVIR